MVERNGWVNHLSRAKDNQRARGGSPLQNNVSSQITLGLVRPNTKLACRACTRRLAVQGPFPHTLDFRHQVFGFCAPPGKKCDHQQIHCSRQKKYSNQKNTKEKELRLRFFLNLHNQIFASLWQNGAVHPTCKQRGPAVHGPPWGPKAPGGAPNDPLCFALNEAFVPTYLWKHIYLCQHTFSIFEG